MTISTHALREEGDAGVVGRGGKRQISTHALREEGDYAPLCQLQDGGGISTHALREEGDWPSTQACQASKISTHALREEGDSKCAIKQKLFSGSICTMRYSSRKKRAVFVQAALSLERSLHV